MTGWLLLVIALALAVTLASRAGRDAVARFSGGSLPVHRIVGAKEEDEQAVRALFAYLVTMGGREQIVLAPSQRAAAAALLEQDGAAGVACLVRRYRIVRAAGGWSVSILPPAWRALGKDCEHGGRHAPEPAGPLPDEAKLAEIADLVASKLGLNRSLEAAVMAAASQPDDPATAAALDDALLEAALVSTGLEIVEPPAGSTEPPRIRLRLMTLDGQPVLPLYTAEARVPPEAVANLGPPRPVRLATLLAALPDPPEVILNPGSPFPHRVSRARLERLRQRAAEPER